MGVLTVATKSHQVLVHVQRVQSVLLLCVHGCVPALYMNYHCLLQLNLTVHAMLTFCLPLGGGNRSGVLSSMTVAL